MKLYVQFMIILMFSLVGEIISTVFKLPVPGSIIGLILLFIALELKLVRLRHIYTVGKFLLNNMTILYPGNDKTNGQEIQNQSSNGNNHFEGDYKE